MLDPDERRTVAARFGAAEEQVARDHLISHILAALPELTPDIVFYGGTALARTHLPDFRLSEDIDLLARDRPTTAAALQTRLPRALRREFGPVRWVVGPAEVRNEAASALLSTEDDLRVRVQIGVLDHDRSRWPLELRTVHMRYADVDPVTLRVPTRTTFVAMKMFAWENRRVHPHARVHPRRLGHPGRPPDGERAGPRRVPRTRARGVGQRLMSATASTSWSTSPGVV
ncbi:hypothetical protein GCM10029964_125510 [Kibdelosporangium lantanae]